MPKRPSSSLNRGFFGIGIFHPKHEVNMGTLFRSATNFGASYVFTVGRRYKEQNSDTTKTWRHIPFYHFESVADLKKHLPKACPLIGVELDEKAHDLTKYIHPERACYMLGAEDCGLPKRVVSECHELVVIPELNQCLNVAVAGSILMYARKFGTKYSNNHSNRSLT